MITENLSNLKFNIMSNEKFDEKQENDLLQENEIYLTPAPKVDNEPIENSKNLITSGGVFEALQTAGGVSEWEDIQNKPENLSDFNNDLGFQTETQVSSAINSKASEVEAKIPTIPTNVSAFTNDAGYLTEHQNLDAYALKTEIPTIPTNVSTFVNDAGYLTEHQSLDAYALKTEIPTVPTNVSAFTNDAGYLTQHQSLANYALKTEVNAKQDKLTFDTTPTVNSTNPVTSGGIKTALDSKASSSHNHSASEINSGTLSTDRLPTVTVAKGGTGYTSITDTTYTTERYRASSLNSSETTPTNNGVIAWMYE